VIIDYLYGVTHIYSPTLSYLRENTFSRHNAITQLLENFTACVAAFAGLRNFKLSVGAEPQFAADFQSSQVDTFRGDILGKITGRDFRSFCSHFVYGFGSKQAYLSVPITCVGVSDNAKVSLQFSLGHINFSRAPLL
jgi:hypothetical protein